MENQYTFVENINKDEINALAAQPGVKSHFLSSYEWGEVCKKRGNIVHRVGVEKNGQLVASAMMIQKRLVLGYSYFYIPRGFMMDYSNLELLAYMTEQVHQYCKKHKGIYFKIDPDIKLQTIDIEGKVVEGEDNHQLVEWFKKKGYTHLGFNYFFEREQPRFTFRIPLEDDLETIEGRYSRTTKARIKQSVNSQVEVVKGTAEDVKEFVRLMIMTEKRQDFFSHEKEYYQYFYDILAKSDMVTLYLGKVNIAKLQEKAASELEALEAERKELEGVESKKAINRCKEIDKKIVSVKGQFELLKDKPQGEVVVSTYFITKYMDKAWALYAANDMTYGKFYGNYAVYRQQIRDAKEEGRKIFDVFGTIGKPGSDSRLAGLYEFKKKWGGEYTEFIGEFDYVENKGMYFLYKKLIPLYHKMVNKKLRKQVQSDER